MLNAAKERKKQGFTALKMNAVESVSHFRARACNHLADALLQLDWLDSPHALDATVQRLADVKSVGMDVGYASTVSSYDR